MASVLQCRVPVSRLARVARLALALILPMVAGCFGGNTYTLKLTPEGDQLGRKYVVTPRHEAESSWTYARYSSRMGSASAYVEDFAGPQDPDRLTKMREAADKLTALLIGWFGSELGKDAHWEALHEFLDVDFRRDLKHLSELAHQYDLMSSNREREGTAIVVRVLQYLKERGYFTMAEVPRITRTLNEESGQRAMGLVQRQVAKRMGVSADAPIPDSLAFLSSTAKAGASLEAYVQTLDEFKEQVADWKQKTADGLIIEEPDPEGYVGDLIVEACGLQIDFLFLSDHLAVELKTPAEPFETNGQWHADLNKTSWSEVLASDGHSWLFCYAFWSEPEEDFQKEHFGRVVLTGEDLSQYVIWRNGLTQEEARLWDDFVSGLAPGEELQERIRSFQFPDAPNLADTPRGLLLDALK
jgi:hypothetical protein